MPRKLSKGIGSITPDMAKITPLKYSELSPEKRMVIGRMIDMWLEWAQSVPRIMEMVEEAMKEAEEKKNS